MNRVKAADELYKLVHDTFESNGFKVGAILGSHNQKNEVQFTLMKSIALLKDSSQPQDEACNQILANVNLAHTLGYVSDETFKNIEDIVGEL